LRGSPVAVSRWIFRVIPGVWVRVRIRVRVRVRVRFRVRVRVGDRKKIIRFASGIKKKLKKK
jgi:hypothetical protein